MSGGFRLSVVIGFFAASLGVAGRPGVEAASASSVWPQGAAPTVPTQQPFVAVSPTRVLDTRLGLGAAVGPLSAGGRIDVQVTGMVDTLSGAQIVVPSGATAVVLNVTAVDSTAPSFVTVWPTGAARPLASTLNVASRDPVPNLIEVQLGDGGRVSLFNNAGLTSLIADIAGWVGSGAVTGGGLFQPLAPARLLDTRLGAGPVAAGDAGVVTLAVAGHGGVPNAGVVAVALNVTVTEPTSASYVTTWPSGAVRPTASNLNFVGGQTVANRVIVKLGADGAVRFYNNAGTIQLVVDVNGYYSAQGGSSIGASFHGITPLRVTDTRAVEIGPLGAVGANGAIVVPVAGQGQIPSAVSGVPPTAVVANITVTNSTAASYLTAWPSGSARQVTSDLNFGAGQTVANLAIVKVGADGTFNIYNNAGSTDIVVDLLGWYSGDVVLDPDLVILDAADAGGIASYDRVGGVLVTSTHNGAFAKVVPGSVLNAGITPATPQGLLVTVVSVSAGPGDGLTLHTAPASLKDAVGQGALHASLPLTTPTPASLTTAASKPRTNITAGASVSVPFDETFTDPSGTATVSGEFTMAGSVDVNVDIGFFHDSGSVTASLSEDFTATLTAQAHASWSGTKLIKSIDFEPVVVEIGPVPVVLLPGVDVELKASGSVDATLTAGVTQHQDLTLGVQFDGSDVTPIDDANSNLTPIGPTINGNADAKAAIEATLSLNTDGVLTFKVGAAPFVRVHATLCGLQLFGGVDVSAGIKLSVLDETLLDKSISKTFERRLVAVDFGLCWTGTITIDSSTHLTRNTASDVIDNLDTSSMTYTILRAGDDPTNYEASVSGAASINDSESNPVTGCSNLLMLQWSGTSGITHNLTIEAGDAGQATIDLPFLPSVTPPMTGQQVVSGPPECNPQTTPSTLALSPVGINVGEVGLFQFARTATSIAGTFVFVDTTTFGPDGLVETRHGTVTLDLHRLLPFD